MKKVLSLVLAAVLVLGVAAVGFAAIFTSTDDLAITLGDSSKAISLSQDFGPDNKKVTFYLGLKDATGAYAPVTKEQVRKEKLDVQIRASEGSSVVKNAKVEYDKVTVGGVTTEYAKVVVNFVGEFVSTKEQAFTVSVYPTVNKVRVKTSEFVITGEYKNETQEVGENDDYVYLGEAPVVEAKDYIKNIRVELGQGISIYTKMFEGKKYYGAITQDVKAEDEAILSKYPAIDTVYYLKTINLNASGDAVEFKIDGNLYVYAQDEDSNLVFIGRTNDRVPYATKYFLASKELDIDELPGDDDDEPTTTEPAPGGDGGGDGEAPSNVNNNPGTGR